MLNNTSQRLFMFTGSFPFGKGESFIENEIQFLAKSFNKVQIIPLYYGSDNKTLRNTPENCEILSPIIKNKWQQYVLGIFCLKSLKIYGKDFLKKKAFKHRKWLKAFFIDLCITNNLIHSNTIKKILKEIQTTDILYFYWAKGSTNFLPFFPPILAKKIVRFHGGDLYEEEYVGYIPIQPEIFKEISMAVFISKHGQQYLKTKYPQIKLNSKVSYLGSNDNGISKRSIDKVFRLLSCSSVIPLKRIFLLYEALQIVENIEIEWTHIGGGVDLDKLKNIVKKSRKNIHVSLLGEISNQEVLKYYQKNQIDAFINISTTEGIPFSIMEAISFNVPVIGTNVGGTSEIVTTETGILISSEPSVYDIVEALNKIQYLKLQPRLFWKKNFNSAFNYPEFINNVLNSSI
jgi:colanic acid/amylovoran biosynthesis glycosyltransferase